MLSRVKAAWACAGIALTHLPITLEAWCVSAPRRHRRPRCGCPTIIMAGKRHDTLTMDGKKPDASPWNKALVLHDPTWGIDVPACRVQGHRPTCGAITRFFLHTSTTRSASLMHVSHVSMRGAALWHLWPQHHLVAWFWTRLTSICPSRAMP
jgi:hypothetical protein